MREVVFTKLQADGFRTLHNFEFEFDTSGLYLVMGTNGQGKTTVFEALYYAVTGNNLKGSRVGDLVTYKEQRPKGFSGMVVALSLTVNGSNYQIYRFRDLDTMKTEEGTTIEGTGVVLFDLDKGENISDKQIDNAAVQEQIYGLLGVSEKAFLNSVLFGQQMERLSTSTSGTIYSILEELFPLDVCDDLQAQAKAKVEGLSTIQEHKYKEHTKCEAQKEAAERNLSHKKSDLNEEIARLATLKKKKKELVSENQDLSEYQEKAKKHEAFLEKYYQTIDKINTGLGDIMEMKAKRSELKLNYERARNEAVQLNNELGAGVCNSCNQPLPEPTEAAKQGIQERISGSVAEAKQIASEISALDANYSKEVEQKFLDAKAKWEDAKAKWDLFGAQYRQVKQSIDQFQQEKTNLGASIQASEATIDKMQNSLKELTNTLQDCTKMASTAKEELGIIEEELEKVTYWAKTGFGIKGMKGYLFNVYLQELNQACAEYGATMGIEVQFVVELHKKSKTVRIEVAQGNKVADYRNFSGGEKARVDITIALALNKILSSGSVNFNVLILDEVFEGLDGEGMQSVRELTIDKSDTTAVYVITHFTDLTREVGTDIIEVVKEKERTKFLRA